MVVARFGGMSAVFRGWGVSTGAGVMGICRVAWFSICFGCLF